MKQPWAKIGMSRATWYRHGKPATKPRKVTQAQIAATMKVSVRTMQRTKRVAREAPELLPAIRSGEVSVTEAERAILAQNAPESRNANQWTSSLAALDALPRHAPRSTPFSCL
jgi:hypothetical protein